MTIDATKAAIPQVQQDPAPISQKKSSSIWNNICVTVKKGCSKTANFFKTIFRAIGNFFKAIGKFLWNNKVTVAICAFLSATVLTISACFLAMFGKKKQVKESTIPEEEKKDVEVKSGNTKVAVDPSDDQPKNVEKRNKKKTKISSAISQFETQPAKVRKTNNGDKVVTSEFVKRMQQQIQESKEAKVEKKDDHEIKSTGLVQRMQQQIQAEKEKEAEKKDDVRSSVEFSSVHSLLANVKFMSGPQPVIQESVIETDDSDAKASEKNTQAHSEILKAKPRIQQKRRLPSRRPRPQASSIVVK